MIYFECPMPPSGNSRNEMSIKRAKGGKSRIHVRNCDKTTVFYSHMRGIFLQGGFETIRSHCAVKMHITPPDKRRRDIDNILKTLFDGMTKGGFIADDHLIKKIYAEIDTKNTSKGGIIRVKITKI